MIRARLDPDTGARAFKALSERNRLRLLRAVLAAERPVCGCELVDALDLADYQVSRGLATLREAGLVRDLGRTGSWVHYEPARGDDPAVDELLDVVTRHVELDAVDQARLDARMRVRADLQCVLGSDHPLVAEALAAATHGRAE